MSCDLTQFLTPTMCLFQFLKEYRLSSPSLGKLETETLSSAELKFLQEIHAPVHQ